MSEPEDPSRPSGREPAPIEEERRYTEEEFAVILRAASKVPKDPTTPTPATPRRGLTLSEIQEIASEVGIDPNRVSRAAALLPVEESSPLMKLVGGGTRYRIGGTVPGPIPTKDLGRIIEIVRQTAGIPGQTREVLGGLEWTGSTATKGYGASVTPRGDRTHLQVWANHTETMAGIYGGVGMGTLGVLALTLVKLVFGESDAGILASLLMGIPPAFLVARTTWKRSSRKLRERLHDLLVGMRREAEAVVEEEEQEI